MDPFIFSLARETDTIRGKAALKNFNSWKIKVTLIQKSHLALDNLAKLAFWSISSGKNGSFAKFLSFFCVSVSLVRENLRELRELFYRKIQSKLNKKIQQMKLLNFWQEPILCTKLWTKQAVALNLNLLIEKQHLDITWKKQKFS